MKRYVLPLLLPLALLSLLAGSASAQRFGFGAQKANATLHTRVEGDSVRAAIRFDIDLGWHLYHSELGHPDAVGMPTVIKMGGEGISWSEPLFPEPHKSEQAAWDAWIYDHSGSIVVYVAGRLGEGADTSAITADISGQTCEEKEGGTCILYKELAKDAGEGSDEVFASFPNELFDGLAAPAAPAPDDKRTSGRADATAYQRIDGSQVLVAVEIDIERGWHLYHDELGHPDAIGKPLVVSLAAEGVEWGPVVVPAPHEIPQFDDVFILGHDGKIVLRAVGEIAEGATAPDWITVKLSGQTCLEDGQCILYGETAYTRGEGDDALFEGFDGLAAGGGGDADAGGHGDEDSDPYSEDSGDEDGIAGFLLTAVFWGFITLLMPCTYPMIPITVSFFTKQAADRESSVLPLSLAYGFGIVAIFVLIGVVVGPVIVEFARHPITNTVIAVMFIYFALVLFGAINLNPPRFLLELAGKASTSGGLIGVFLMGATLVITSFTCTAPFVGTLLASGGTERTITEVALGMGVFGLTMAVPFVVLSLVPGMIKNIPNSGQWMNTFKVTMGFVELAAAFKFISNAELVWKWDLLSRELFLLLWAIIFGLAAIYLFGLLPGKREKARGGRLVAAAVALAVSGYSAWGMAGKPLDPWLMTPMVPPYSGGLLMPEWYDFGSEWTVVKDDFDQAADLAKAEKKAVFVNFTGHT